MSRLRPTHIAYSYLVAEVFLHLALPIRQVIHFPYTLLGIPILILALIINVWASALFAGNKTTLLPFEKPSTFISNGPFRYSRNPIYLSAVMIALGLALLLGSLVVFLAPPLMLVTLDALFIRHEEENLGSVFGEAYTAYKQRVRRWL